MTEHHGLLFSKLLHITPRQTSACRQNTNVYRLVSTSETTLAGSAGRAKGATGKDSEATSVLAAEYFCLEPVVGRRPGHTRDNLNLHAYAWMQVPNQSNDSTITISLLNALLNHWN